MNDYEKLNLLANHFEKLAIKNRGICIFPANSGKNKSNKDRFPINDENQARNALARANQYSSAPEWYNGSLQSLVNSVARHVKRKYPGIEVTKKSTNPGKG